MDFHARKDSMQQSLFGDSDEVNYPEISLPDCRPWSKLEQLKFEKEVTGFYMSGHPLDDFQFEIEQFCTVTIEDLKQDMKPLRGKEITFAGIVLEATHKIGKTGKPFGTFIIEDYYNFISINIFSEDYLRWKHLLEAGQYLFLRGRIESRFDNPDQLVVKVTQINLLQEVLEKMTKALVITFPLNDITPEIVTKLLSRAKQSKGRSALRIRIVDPIENIVIEMPSRKYKVNPREFINLMNDLYEFPIRAIGI